MKRFSLLFLFFLGFIPQWNAQQPALDRLEVYYAQKHYRLVYRRANRLMELPDYDYSKVPSFYKAISLFQLAKNPVWWKRHPDALQQASVLIKELYTTTDGKRVVTAHYKELQALNKDLISWAEQLKQNGETEKFVLLQQAMQGLFDGIPDTDQHQNESESLDYVLAPGLLDGYAVKREKLFSNGREQLGKPYLWGGVDPNGFDCSGFITYVFFKENINLPRRAVDQYNASVKLEKEAVMRGDLVFFDSGSGISHVGMIISGKGQPLKMIHSSSSKGIIITDIEASEYWSTRIVGFGTFVY